MRCFSRRKLNTSHHAFYRFKHYSINMISNSTVFDFENPSNFTNEKIPSLKAINKDFCGDPNSTGLWIALDNMITCGWRKTCDISCSDVLCKHYEGTAGHIVYSTNGPIQGFGILNPRIIVLKRSALLKLNEHGVVEGLWKKGDGLLKNDKEQRKFTCVRKYLIVFVDRFNKPLHKEYIQFTARGTFQVDFDQNLLKFRKDFSHSFLKSKKLLCSKTVSEKWFSMCVFVPKFKQRLVGKNNMISKACFVHSFEEVNEHNWQNYCVAKDLAVNEFIMVLWEKSEAWSKKIVARQNDVIENNIDFELSNTHSSFYI